jgi:hypothetical protein
MSDKKQAERLALIAKIGAKITARAQAGAALDHVDPRELPAAPSAGQSLDFSHVGAY